MVQFQYGKGILSILYIHNNFLQFLLINLFTFFFMLNYSLNNLQLKIVDLVLKTEVSLT